MPSPAPLFSDSKHTHDNEQQQQQQSLLQPSQQDTTTAATTTDIWYFAYGSNMLRDKFTRSRGIVPKAAVRARVPGWVLAFDIPGLPYSEPSFTSVGPRPPPGPSTTGTTTISRNVVPGEKPSLTAAADRKPSQSGGRRTANSSVGVLPALVAAGNDLMESTAGRFVDAETSPRNCEKGNPDNSPPGEVLPDLGQEKKERGEKGYDGFSDLDIEQHAPGRDALLSLPSPSPSLPSSLSPPPPPPDVHGVAYLITQAQYVQVLASEGGSEAYTDIELWAEALDDIPSSIPSSSSSCPSASAPCSPHSYCNTSLSNLNHTYSPSSFPPPPPPYPPHHPPSPSPSLLKIRTLSPSMRRLPAPYPSARYMSLILLGARESNLPSHYQSYLHSLPIYEPPQNLRGKLGAAIFLAFWVPVMGVLEWVTKATMGRGGLDGEEGSVGDVPSAVVALVRGTMYFIWVVHDVFFAPVVGRGDGWGRRK